MDNEKNEITLGVLNSINNNSYVTQRSMSKELGIALGLTNSYLKRCVKKGLIKVQQIPANRYAYYLTPQGFSEKSRLAHEYFSQGFRFFRVARVQCVDIYTLCIKENWNRIILHGLTDLAEIAILCAKDSDIQLISIVDCSTSVRKFAGIPIVRKLPPVDQFDAIVITDLGEPQKEFNKIVHFLGSKRVFIPPFLGVKTSLSHKFMEESK